MTERLAGQLGSAPYRYFGEWTQRIAKGELPFAKPERPKGVERNLVITSWAWSTPDKYMHDLISSDRRNPTVNANGKLYGSPEYSTDLMPILDPKTHTATTFRMPVRDPNMPLSLGPGHAANVEVAAPSAYWGERQLWDTRANNHNAMFDEQGRVWNAASIRAMPNPDFCKEGSDASVGQAVPARHEQPATLDPRSEDDAVHLRRHLLRHPSPAVRQEQHPVGERQRAGGRMARRQGVPRDRRRRPRAGLGAVRARHQRQRHARRMERAGQADEDPARTRASAAPAPMR